MRQPKRGTAGWKTTFSKFIIPPFLGDSGFIGGACPGRYAARAGASEAEDHTDNQNGEGGKEHTEPHLTESKAKAWDINAKQGPDSIYQGFTQGNSGIKHNGSSFHL